MEKLLEILNNIIENNELILLVLSNKRNSDDMPKKVNVTAFATKGVFSYQFANHFEKKVTHYNKTVAEVVDEVISLLASYKNVSIYSANADYQVLCGKNGNVNIKKTAPTKKLENNIEHNKKKNYILQDMTKYDFLIELDIMTVDGKVKAQKYNKFVQINKYLEIISHSINTLKKEKTINIIDFGCGKAYLTFALYYYLCEVQGLDVKIIGVDLKQDVINLCNDLASKLGYEKMEFVNGDIKDFNSSDDIDMVISLHACDTATDEAIIKAIEWNSKVIIAVPCCQHELFSKMNNEIFKPVQQYGILNDKLATIITDSIRGLVLQIKGYNVSIMEFTPLEHTAKNVLIRAEYTGKPDKKAQEQYKNLTEFWGVRPYIEKIIE